MGTEIHVVLGMDPDEYEAELMLGRTRPDWEGIPVSKEPRWHSHPLLGISGHSHRDGRRPHTHMPEWTWDFTPVFLEEPTDNEKESHA